MKVELRYIETGLSRKLLVVTIDGPQQQAEKVKNLVMQEMKAAEGWEPWD